MILWLVLAAVLGVATVWFLVRPLARGAHVESREQYYQLQIVRDRLLAQLNELDLDERDRSMDAGTAVDERARLEAELALVLKQLEVLGPEPMPAQAEHARARPMWRGIVAVLIVAVPTVAASLYVLNASMPLTRLEQAASAPAASPAGAPDPLQMVARLEKRMQEHPDDARGWMMLGRSYAVLGRPEDAKLAYDHAYRLLPKDFQPDSPDAFWFLGFAAYNHGDTRRALDLWNKLLASMPAESDAARQLRTIMEQARKQSGKK